MLRVVNDDLVKARSGFGTHPHRDMVRLGPRPCSRLSESSVVKEIFSYVVDGEVIQRQTASRLYFLTKKQLSHQDSMGNREALGRGAVQYLSAGTGITHSEMNDGAETCRSLCVHSSRDGSSFRDIF